MHSLHLVSKKHLTSLHTTQRECLSNCNLLIRRVQRGQDRRAETSAAAEVVGVKGDEGTDAAVAGTSLALSVFLPMVNRSKEYPKAHPEKRLQAGDQIQVSVNRRKRVMEAGVLTGRRQFEN